MPNSSIEYQLEMREEQSARDPYLCHWAEYYFLASLCHALLTDVSPYVYMGTLLGEQATFFQKGYLRGVPYERWPSPKNIKTGQPTTVVLSGPYADSIVIDQGPSLFLYGRQIGAGFNSIDMLPNNVSQGSKVYMDALYQRIQAVRQRGESYTKLYTRVSGLIDREARERL